MKKLSLNHKITFKSIFAMVVMLILFAAIVSAIGFVTFTNALLSQYADDAFLTAETAAEFINADKMDAYITSNGKTAEYRAVWNDLDRICNSSGSTFVYVIVPDKSDYAHITFYFSTINHDSHYSLYDFGYVRETTNDEYREKYKALYEKKASQELVIRDKGYIETDPHITAMIAIEDSNGTIQGILCVQRQMDVLAKARQHYITRVVMLFVILSILAAIGQSAYLNNQLLKPLKIMNEETERFSKENSVANRRLMDKIHNQDEIGELAASIDQMEWQIEKHVENLANVIAEKKRIEAELDLAGRIQAAMLPNTFPPFPEKPEIDIYASMHPAREVGGDFYDIYLIDNDHVCITIADVSGKGVPAALFMMASMIALKSNAMSNKTPAQILKNVNEAICANNKEEMFVTVWLGIIDLSTGKMTAANAGHEYPILKRKDEDFSLYKDLHGFVIGGFSGITYKEYEIYLNPGDKLFLYTDGIPEAENQKKEQFGIERLINSLNSHQNETPTEIIKNIQKDVDEFVGNAEQFDDSTMLCFETKKNNK